MKGFLPGFRASVAPELGGWAALTRLSPLTRVRGDGFARDLFWLKGFPMPELTTCPSCGKDVSPKAFDCPHCGHPLRKPKRGFFGKLF